MYAFRSDRGASSADGLGFLRPALHLVNAAMRTCSWLHLPDGGGIMVAAHSVVRACLHQLSETCRGVTTRKPSEPRPLVLGLNLDSQNRCAHYHTTLDIIAIKMRCCGEYYACAECHDALAEHHIEVWPREERDQMAVLCGACHTELSINEYLRCDSCCPACGARFNTRCRNHHHLYFEQPT